jgi:hypothetical protein
LCDRGAGGARIHQPNLRALLKGPFSFVTIKGFAKEPS